MGWMSMAAWRVSQARTVAAFSLGGKTGYQTLAMRACSQYQAMRWIMVLGPPLSTGKSKVGRFRARVRARSLSLRKSKGTWLRSLNSCWWAVVLVLRPKTWTLREDPAGTAGPPLDREDPAGTAGPPRTAWPPRTAGPPGTAGPPWNCW